MAKTAVNGYLKVKDEIEKRSRLGMKWDPETLKYIPELNASPGRIYGTKAGLYETLRPEISANAENHTEVCA